MKQVTLFLVFTFFCSSVIFSQQKITIQNGFRTQFYNTLEETLQNSVSGDTIYLPGTTISYGGDIIIDKPLAIIGAGWDMDFIGMGLMPTVLYTNIVLKDGADGTFITGCSFNDFLLDCESIQNITLSRNKITGNLTLGGKSGVAKSINIIENVMAETSSSINGSSASGCIVINNLFRGRMTDFKNSDIKNNIATGIYMLESCIIENNYLTGQADDNIGLVSNCTLNNNAFQYGFVMPGSCAGQNNMENINLNDAFQGPSSWDHPRYYELKSGSSLENAGADGTDIGIYGGSNPYKTGAIPMNPHIERFSVSYVTDGEERLIIDIQVSAQTR